MSQDTVVELIGTVKKGRRKTIGPLNLQIPKGYIVAFVGPNGSGKSTMMQMILQTICPDEGVIRWYGEAHSGELPLDLRQKIGYVPEISATEENYMTAEVAASFRSYWYPSWDEEYFESLMTRFDVPRRERLNRMSKGERRKFEIAAALAAKPKLLLLDEPSSGLDPFAWKHMIDELRKCMEEEEVTIILATHIVEEIKRLADYIAFVYQGQVLGIVEKDLLLGSWKEIWVRNDEPAHINEFPGEVIRQEDGPSISKLVVQEEPLLDELYAEQGLQIIKSRSLELEEIMELWIEGHRPAVPAQ